MFILYRYLSRQIVISMLAVSGVLLLIFMSGRFIKYLAQAASGGLSANVLFSIMGYRLPGFLELILPLGLFIGILLAYGRMYLESEMTVLYACGYSQRKLVVHTLTTSLIVAAVVGLLSLYVTPWGMKNVENIFTDQSKLTEFEVLTAGRFQKLRSGQRVTYTEAMSEDKKVLINVFISETTKDGQERAVLVARSGQLEYDEQTGSRFLVLRDGARFQGTPGALDYRIVQFEKYGVRIEDLKADKIKQKDEAISTQELLHSDSPKHKALLHWRISLPLLVPVVTLLAIALSRVNPRQGRFFHLLPAMLIYVLYLGLLIGSRKWIEKEKVPEYIGMWWVHLLFLTVSLYLLFGRDWLKSRKLKRAQA
ncbi:MAG: LPS export ABC transporter permease LptF [Pseudomonadales bacterium]|uniref:Lipopolysaccharide export system permease protein LptF n=1 Tax=Oleiphilus messinensis TaxID=141451 RepID=A0A1Y0ICW0_9GAMM|nr:LPS export ABC transporter permease LptF [Oleiphilus messinensis]ARU57616.1 outer membrane lipopolysaccharide export porin [Oleiphilus messinensis]MCG8613090.1 LPS export ABC transporter permease LptF [Pseudomonadales bacterium]